MCRSLREIRCSWRLVLIPRFLGYPVSHGKIATLIRSAEPRECSEEVKEAAAGLMFAAAWCGELPELLDARAILADKFGRDFARAAKDGAHGVVDPTVVALTPFKFQLTLQVVSPTA